MLFFTEGYWFPVYHTFKIPSQQHAGWCRPHTWAPQPRLTDIQCEPSQWACHACQVCRASQTLGGCPQGHVSLGRSWAIGLLAGALQRPECPPWFPFSSCYLARSLRPWRSFSLPTVMGVVIILSTRVPWLASKENFCLPHTLLLLLIGCRAPGLLSPDRHWCVAWDGLSGSEMNRP